MAGGLDSTQNEPVCRQSLYINCYIRIDTVLPNIVSQYSTLLMFSYTPGLHCLPAVHCPKPQQQARVTVMETGMRLVEVEGSFEDGVVTLLLVLFG